MADYIPRVLSQLAAWFVNFSAKLAVHGPSLGVTVPEIAAAAADSTAVQHVINGQQVRRTDAEEFTAFKDEVLYGGEGGLEPTPPAPGTITPALPDPLPFNILTRTRSLAQRIKNHPNYTTAIGEDLGIEAAAPTPGEIKPQLDLLEETSFGIRVNFAMKGFPMIEIQCKRGNEADFTIIGYDSSAPYLDARPPLTPGQPEVREYRARFRDGNGPIGNWSDVVTATARP